MFLDCADVTIISTPMQSMSLLVTPVRIALLTPPAPLSRSRGGCRFVLVFVFVFVFLSTYA